MYDYMYMCIDFVCFECTVHEVCMCVYVRVCRDSPQHCIMLHNAGKHDIETRALQKFSARKPWHQWVNALNGHKESEVLRIMKIWMWDHHGNIQVWCLASRFQSFVLSELT